MERIQQIIRHGRTAAPLSLQQEALWRLPKKEAHVIPPLAMRLEGFLERALMEKAVNQLVQRHESLRTIFQIQNDQPRQVILPALSVALYSEDLSGYSVSDREEKARRFVFEEGSRSFNLTEGPLIRSGLLKLGHGEHILFLTVHHLVSDLWSMRILLHELTDLYSAYIDSREYPLAPLPIQYADFAIFQREGFQQDILNRQLDYWVERLKGASVLRLPRDQVSTDEMSRDGEVLSSYISEQLSTKLRQLGRSEKATLFMTLLAALHIMLRDYSGQDDIVVGSLSANRNSAETAAVVGSFANMLILRTSLAKDLCFREILRRVREVCMEAYENPLPIGEFAPPSLFFALQSVPIQAGRFSGLQTVDFECTGATMFEGTGKARVLRWEQQWQVWPVGKELRVVVIYRTGFFGKATIERMLKTFNDVLDWIVINPDQGLRPMFSMTAWK